ncbi:MAG: hypothetical protein AB1761_04990 [Pseudomonadota bacterium]
MHVPMPAKLGVAPAELIARYPRLYHMAERDSLPSILKHGLLSTSSLLDLYAVNGTRRTAIESDVRSQSIAIEHAKFGRAVVRDQCPMSVASLRRCLRDGLTPRDWIQLLNARVFFWVSEKRLHGLLNAGNYRHQEHDVLILDTASVVRDYANDIDLCPINSGASIPWVQPRGKDTFRPIADYPWSYWLKKRGRNGDTVVELTVKRGVTDVTRHLVEAWRMRGEKRLRRLA